MSMMWSECRCTRLSGDGLQPNEELKLTASRAEGMLPGLGTLGLADPAWMGRSLTPVRYDALIDGGDDES